MQQPTGEVARHPRTNSDLTNGSSAAAAIGRRHHRAGGHSSSRSSRFQQQDSTTSNTSSSSSNNTSADEDNRSEEDAAGGAELAAMLMSHLGLSSSGQAHTGISPSSAPSGTSISIQGRRSENGTQGSGSSSLFHNRNNHPQPHRFGGSQRLRGSRPAGGLSGSSASTSELLANGRLGALLQSLDAAVASSVPSSSTSDASLRAMGTQQQQAALKRLRHSLPLLQLLGRDIKCPVCHKGVPSDDVEVHLVMCLTRPVLSYNDDVLTADKGECAICLEEMNLGDNIARLPCLCIYHKDCIDEWFKRKNTCPEHPPTED